MVKLNILKLNNMRNNYITNDKYIVFINSTMGDRSPYAVEKIGLDDRRDRIYSDWILHLVDKNWIQDEDLYELAVIIQNESPKYKHDEYLDSEIDWYKTFLVVETYREFSIKDSIRSQSDICETVRQNLKRYNLN